jgi:hypothetical protein
MKKLIIILCLLLPITVWGQHDTLVRKKYIDSLKHQLAIYSVTSYNHLNMYDKAETEKNKLKKTLDTTDKKVSILKDNSTKVKLIAGLVLLYALITLLTMDTR